MIVAGIDPGTVGAAAVIDTLAVADLHSMSWDDDKHPLRLSVLAGWLHSYGVTHVVIERAQSMPKQGVSSTFKYGVSYGKLLGLMEMLPVELTLVVPRVWKKHFDLLKKPKSASLELARALWPVAAKVQLQRVKDTHRAEAALIAAWFKHREG